MLLSFVITTSVHASARVECKRHDVKRDESTQRVMKHPSHPANSEVSELGFLRLVQQGAYWLLVFSHDMKLSSRLGFLYQGRPSSPQAGVTVAFRHCQEKQQERLLMHGWEFRTHRREGRCATSVPPQSSLVCRAIFSSASWKGCHFH